MEEDNDDDDDGRPDTITDDDAEDAEDEDVGRHDSLGDDDDVAEDSGVVGRESKCSVPRSRFGRIKSFIILIRMETEGCAVLKETVRWDEMR